jgi:hypothetical protein
VKAQRPATKGVWGKCFLQAFGVQSRRKVGCPRGEAPGRSGATSEGLAASDWSRVRIPPGAPY